MKKTYECKTCRRRSQVVELAVWCPFCKPSEAYKHMVETPQDEIKVKEKAGIFCANDDCDGADINKIPGGHVHYQAIDPVTQVFMDFFASMHEPNPEGKTRLVDYGFWADLAWKAMDCACHEGWRKDVTHSKYECHGEKYGVLRAEGDFQKGL